MRLTIADLALGKDYKVQVQAVSGTEYGPWSPILDIPATNETNTPPSLSPDEITISTGTGNAGDSFVATWSYASIQNDFDHYEYKWLGSSSGSSTITSATIFSSTSPSATLTYSQNTALFGSAKPYINIQVRAVNTSKISGSFVTGALGAQNIIPSAPTSLITTTAPDSIKLEWTAPSPDPLDLDYYRIDVSTTDSTSGFVTIGTVKSPNIKYEYSSTYYDKLHWFRVYSIDKFGQTSSSYAANSVGTEVSPPAVMSGLICRLSSYIRSTGTANTSFTTTTPHGLSVGDKVYIHDAVSDQNTITNISVTGTTAIATTNAAHNFAIDDTVLIAASSNDSFNETVIVTAVTTSIPYTFTYQSKASGVYSGYSYAYAKTGLSTANTPFGSAAEVLSIPTDKSFTCAPNVGTCAVNNYSTSHTVSSVTFDGTYVTYNLGSYPSGIVGFKLNVSGCVPNVFNTDDADITYSGSNLIKIKSSATGSYDANSGTAVARPPGYMYPTDNAVRIKSDGITVGNMSTGYIVGISPTSFNMQSSGSNTRLSLTSSEIAMYKSGDKTVSFDGSNGNATIIGNFSTGFSPNPRVELSSGGTGIAEYIKFYSESAITNPGYIKSDAFYINGYTHVANTSSGSSLPTSRIYADSVNQPLDPFSYFYSSGIIGVLASVDGIRSLNDVTYSGITPSFTKSITAITGTAPGTRTASIANTGSDTIVSGDKVEITGVTPSSLNEIVTVTSANTTSFTYTSANSGTYSSSGTATRYASFNNCTGGTGTMVAGSPYGGIEQSYYNQGILTIQPPASNYSSIQSTYISIESDSTHPLPSVGYGQISAISNTFNNKSESFSIHSNANIYPSGQSYFNNTFSFDGNYATFDSHIESSLMRAKTYYSTGSVTVADGATGQVSTTGVSFIGPKSGSVAIVCGGYVATNAGSSGVYYNLQTGGTIGSGSNVSSGVNIGGNTFVSGGNAGYGAYLNGPSATATSVRMSGPFLVISGLTPRSAYNVSLKYYNVGNGAAISIGTPFITVIPQM